MTRPGYQRFKSLLAKADAADLRDGCAAYRVYHDVVTEFADHYGFAFSNALAAFVTLSPNNDYRGNLRSLASVLCGAAAGLPCEEITISTYNHCRDRAYAYVTGAADFLSTARGPKIRAFYLNIADPLDPRPVTIDGHMSCVWQGRDLPMKQAIIKTKARYNEISADLRRVAWRAGLLPNQLQATLWLARKRLLGIKYNPQLDLFCDDFSAMHIRPADAPPYKRKGTE